jgi:hypothetical protein
MEVGHEHFAEDLTFPLRQLKENQNGPSTHAYDFDEINEVTTPLGIPWELSKDVPFDYIVPFIGFSWDLNEKKVSLPESKKEKYLRCIHEWKERSTHTLDDVQKMYGKLLYTCLITPQGRAYLTQLEKMMGMFQEHPFVPRHPPHQLNEDLIWWTNTLSSPSLSRDIPGRREIIDVRGFSDASSTVGIGIVLGDKWRAWRLLPNWKSGGRDIGWAEAVGMELLVRTILHTTHFPGIQIFGDNTGVVEGWWTGRSRNAETNRVFRRIHSLLEKHDVVLKTKYIHTSRNPADDPSRGIFPPKHLLLPPIEIPNEIRPYVLNFDAPSHPSERDTSRCFLPQPKAPIPHSEHLRRQKANVSAEDQPRDPSQTLTLGRNGN